MKKFPGRVAQTHLYPNLVSVIGPALELMFSLALLMANQPMKKLQDPLSHWLKKITHCQSSESVYRMS